jgi:hypothetical protein
MNHPYHSFSAQLVRPQSTSATPSTMTITCDGEIADRWTRKGEKAALK